MGINSAWGANASGKQFEGMKRYDCRVTLMAELERLGLAKKTEGHAMVLPLCSRTKDVLEFVLKPQWFQNCDDMARRAVEAVEKGELNIYPESHKATWYHWLRNIKHWCISRQLWWDTASLRGSSTSRARLLATRPPSTTGGLLHIMRKRHLQRPPNSLARLQTS